MADCERGTFVAIRVDSPIGFTAGTVGDPVVLTFSGATDVSAADVAAGFKYGFNGGAGYGVFGPSPTAMVQGSDAVRITRQ